LKQAFAIYEQTASVKASLDYENHQFALSAIMAQLRLKISQDFEKLELLMLTEVDKLVSGPAQIGRLNPIAV
jgi:hypothetical protein